MKRGMDRLHQSPSALPSTTTGHGQCPIFGVLLMVRGALGKASHAGRSQPFRTDSPTGYRCGFHVAPCEANN